MTHLPLLTSSLPAMEVSKWTEIQALLDIEEIEALLKTLAPVEIYAAGSITARQAGAISILEFMQGYTSYIHDLKAGLVPNMTTKRQLFSSILTTTPVILYALAIDEQRQLIRALKPVVQLQMHALDYSPYDEKFRPMAFGLNSITWGLQFSYPQLFLDPLTKKIMTIDKSAAFPNTALFHTLQRWLRHFTIPTPFKVNGKRFNSSIRIGKQCLSWIASHHQLKTHHLEVTQK